VTVLACVLSLGLLGGGTFLLYEIDPPPAINILILGDDTRTGQAGGEFARTDSIMVASIDPAREQISLMSIPRDLFLQSPSFGPMRANVVIRNAELEAPGSGRNEMVAAIENTFDIEIDHTVRLNFEAFVEVVDAVGGVEIDVPWRLVDYSYPTDEGGTMRVEFEAGMQHMDGERALIYARIRHPDDDYRRAGRQQQVIDALISKLASPSQMGDYPAVWAAFEEHTRTDLELGTMLRLGPAVFKNGGTIERLVIDRELVRYDGSGNAYPDVAALDEWLDNHLRH
jgi:LCP family protein required for cell wall assembly